MAVLPLLILLLNLCLNTTDFAVQGRDFDLNIAEDEFDCIDFYEQPTFSHPSLKDHQVQLKPSFSGSLKKNEELSSMRSYNVVSSEYKGCPVGKVPIHKRRGKEDDSFHRLTKSYPGQHFGVVRSSHIQTFYGVRGSMSIEVNQVSDFQVSAAQVWIQNGTQSQLNSIQAGWEANPILYGDNCSRVTAFWTADNFGKTGCYNTRCPGFVQVDKQYFLGKLCPGGDIPGYPRYFLDMMIRQDESSGNWWLIAEGDITIGYWPKELFDSLRDGATFIQYGGWTVNIPNFSSPGMGTGQYATKDFDDTEVAYISKMKLINGGHAEASPDFLAMEQYSDDTSCYTVYYGGYVYRKLEHAMSYGGPGGSCSN